MNAGNRESYREKGCKRERQNVRGERKCGKERDIERGGNERDIVSKLWCARERERRVLPGHNRNEPTHDTKKTGPTEKTGPKGPTGVPRGVH